MAFPPDIQIPQVSYALRPAPAFAGQRSDDGPVDIMSTICGQQATNTGAPGSQVLAAGFDAGFGVVMGTSTAPSTGDRVVTSVLPQQASDVANLFLGVVQFLAQREPYANTQNRYQPGDAAPVASKGRFWVRVDPTTSNPATMVDRGPVYLVYSGPYAGTFRGDNANSNAALVSGARVWTGGTAASGVAEVNFNLT